MIYNNREYPHPVLGINDSIEGSLFVHLSVKSGKDNIRIESVFELDNVDLNNLLETGKAMFAVQVYCRATMYRHIFKSNKPISPQMIIPTQNLRDLVELDFFICAEVNLNDYSNSKAHSDYGSSLFQIDKGDILAYGGNGVFHANKTPEELKAVSSFMQIDKYNSETGPIKNFYDGDKITIQLSKKDYAKYLEIAGHRYAEEILHSSVVLPALMDAIDQVNNSTEEFGQYVWYKILKSLIDEKGKGDKNALITGQKILDNPLNRAFFTIDNLIYTED